MRWTRSLLQLCGRMLMLDDVIPTSCVIAAVAVCLHMLLFIPVPSTLQLTGISGVLASLRTHAAACDDRGTIDVAELDSWYRRHMTFEIVNLAGALRYFADGRL